MGKFLVLLLALTCAGCGDSTRVLYCAKDGELEREVGRGMIFYPYRNDLWQIGYGEGALQYAQKPGESCRVRRAP